MTWVQALLTVRRKCTCVECQRTFEMGKNGITLGGRDLCDSCGQVRRNAEGHILSDREGVYDYGDGTKPT
jgi:hypothetical protein